MERQSFDNIELEDTMGQGLLQEKKEDTKQELDKLAAEDGELEASVIERVGKEESQMTSVDIDKLQLSPDCINGTNGVPAPILTELLNHDLMTYLKDKLRPRYSFFRRVSTENIMKWQDKELSDPLTIMPKEMAGIAVQLFRSKIFFTSDLLSYMGDRNSSKKPVEHIQKHIKLTLTANEEIKDEAYVQVIKQITSHKDYQKSIRGWNFFAIMASSYAPSSSLFYSILNHLLFEIKNNTDVNIVNHANYIFLRLYRSFERKRLNIPSEDEILHIENMRPVRVPVHFFSGNCSLEDCESYTTVREFKAKMMKKLGFMTSRVPYYCLYEICNKRDICEERFLDENERVCDVLSLWERELEENLKKNEQIEFKMYLKIFIYYPYTEIDVDTVSQVFYEGVYDVITGKYSLKEQEIITLAALQLLVAFNTDQDKAYQSLQKKIESYVPVNHLNLNPSVVWIEKIMELYSGLKSTSKLETKLTYIEELKQYPLWETHQFDAKYSTKNVNNSENLPDNLIIGVKPAGISIFDEERNELIHYPYHSIANWGISTAFFVLIVSNEDEDIVKHYFETRQTKVIQALVESYTNLIVGKSINDVQTITAEYSKRFNTLTTGRQRTGTSYKKS